MDFFSEPVPDADSPLDQEIEKAFAGRLTIDATACARLLGVDGKTLRSLVKAGRLSYIPMGSGTRRLRRHFTQDDVAAFFRTQRRQELPALRKTRRARSRTGRDDGFLAYAQTLARRE